MLPVLFLLLCACGFAQEGAVRSEGEFAREEAAVEEVFSFRDFTGRVVENGEKIYLYPDINSHVIAELARGDYVVVEGERGNFYAVIPPEGIKAYVFKGFVIDDVVERDQVNVRLGPSREAPIIGHYKKGESLEGTPCRDRDKWLETSPPSHVRFFLLKESVEYAGGPELKAKVDQRKSAVDRLLDSATLFAQSEMCKPFGEIDVDRIAQNFEEMIADFPDFPDHVDRAKRALAEVKLECLQRKIAFLETRISNDVEAKPQQVSDVKGAAPSPPTDRMKVWDPVEEAHYLTWASTRRAKTVQDFYEDQKLQAKMISGIVEVYAEPVKNKPGDYLLKDQGIPVGYVYSTHIDLQKYVGKRVNLIVTDRPNNSFAFPAYYALNVE